LYSQKVIEIQISQGGSNTDSGSKRGVQYRNTTTMYLAFIIRNLIRILTLTRIIFFVIKKNVEG
jgi:hypothetical protein